MRSVDIHQNVYNSQCSVYIVTIGTQCTRAQFQLNVKGTIAQYYANMIMIYSHEKI